MADDPQLEAAVKATIGSMGKLIKKPPMTDKLLRKPPFRFLHDIITEVRGREEGRREERSEEKRGKKLAVFFGCQKHGSPTKNRSLFVVYPPPPRTLISPNRHHPMRVHVHR